MAERPLASSEISAPNKEFGHRYQALVDDFLKSAPYWKSNTVAAYRSDLTQLGRYLNEVGLQDWPEITPEVIKNFFDIRRKLYQSAPATIERQVISIRGFINWLIGENYPIPQDILGSFSDQAPRSPHEAIN